jgi:hypothetical protein
MKEIEEDKIMLKIVDEGKNLLRYVKDSLT